MAKMSTGLLVHRRRGGRLEVFLVHPGGPFWAKKDLGAWSIPKGECDPEENPFRAAKREFHEETGLSIEGNFRPLRAAKQPGGKTVVAWAVEGDLDPATIKSNTFSMEWPPRSGRQQEFPEIDRAAWFEIDEAKQRILKGQVALLEELERMPARGNPGQDR
jgi:predicted NUDIX family NTP pyrophosphohydrolase